MTYYCQPYSKGDTCYSHFNNDSHVSSLNEFASIIHKLNENSRLLQQECLPDLFAQDQELGNKHNFDCYNQDESWFHQECQQSYLSYNSTSQILEPDDISLKNKSIDELLDDLDLFEKTFNDELRSLEQKDDVLEKQTLRDLWEEEDEEETSFSISTTIKQVESLEPLMVTQPPFIRTSLLCGPEVINLHMSSIAQEEKHCVDDTNESVGNLILAEGHSSLFSLLINLNQDENAHMVDNVILEDVYILEVEENHDAQTSFMPQTMSSIPSISLETDNLIMFVHKDVCQFKVFDGDP